MQSKSISGFKASRNEPPISHILFSHDSIIFHQATEAECMHILGLLHAYVEASRQHVNFQKPAILFGKRVLTETQQNMLGPMRRNKCNAFSYIS